jgi:hypothetical protein
VIIAWECCSTRAACMPEGTTTLIARQFKRAVLCFQHPDPWLPNSCACKRAVGRQRLLSLLCFGASQAADSVTAVLLNKVALCAFAGWGESGNGVIDGLVTSSHITSEKVSAAPTCHVRMEDCIVIHTSCSLLMATAAACGANLCTPFCKCIRVKPVANTHGH